MPGKSGSVYGLTILSPIISDPTLPIAHETALRIYLSELPRHQKSPFALVSSTHLARLVVMDDVVFVGHPAREEHLRSPYLIFTSDLDGDPKPYFRSMAETIPEVVDAIWSHCVGYPGLGSTERFVEYMKECELETTFFFAAINDKTVQESLRALRVKLEVA